MNIACVLVLCATFARCASWRLDPAHLAVSLIHTQYAAIISLRNAIFEDGKPNQFFLPKAIREFNESCDNILANVSSRDVHRIVNLQKPNLSYIYDCTMYELVHSEKLVHKCINTMLMWNVELERLFIQQVPHVLPEYFVMQLPKLPEAMPTPPKKEGKKDASKPARDSDEVSYTFYDLDPYAFRAPVSDMRGRGATAGRRGEGRGVPR